MSYCYGFCLFFLFFLIRLCPREPAGHQNPTEPNSTLQPLSASYPSSHPPQAWPNPLLIPPEIALTMNPDAYSIDHLPFGFPAAPPKPAISANIGSSLSAGYVFYFIFVYFPNR
jgi:hypothetical protein